MDLDIKTFMFILKLKEARQKKYTVKQCDKNLVYIFKDEEEFWSYFINNGLKNVDHELLKLCRLKEFKNKKVLALKSLCDYAITKSKYSKSPIELTQEQIDEIHNRGHITAMEMVEQWEEFGLCAPGDAMGSNSDRCASNRCNMFENCHECLVNYASQKEEYTSLYDKFKIVNSPFPNRQKTKK